MTPEKTVEQKVLFEARKLGFWLHVYESKAVFNKRLGIYKKSTALPEGHPDLAGITPCQKPCYIELKAPGRLKQLRDKQLLFLREAIRYGGFALAIDRPELLKAHYQTWKISENPKAFLYSLLPPC